MAVVIGIVVAINPTARQQVLNAPADASRWAAFLMSGAALTAAHDLWRPGSGEQGLPPEVLGMLSLVRGHDIATFSLSPRIVSNVLWVQRLTESAFPRRIVVEAHDRLALAGENLPAECRVGAEAEGAVLARCR